MLWPFLSLQKFHSNEKCFFLSFLPFNSRSCWTEVKLIVLGTAQDAGAPQIACKKDCCADLWESGKTEAVVALGLVDASNQKHYLFEATPNITQQLQDLNSIAGKLLPSEVFFSPMLIWGIIAVYSF